MIINLGYKTQCDKWIKIKNIMEKVDFNVLAWDGGPRIQTKRSAPAKDSVRELTGKEEGWVSRLPVHPAP